MRLPAPCIVHSSTYGAHRAIDGNSMSDKGFPFYSSTAASAVRAPAMAGVTMQLDRAYSDIVAVQVMTGVEAHGTGVPAHMVAVHMPAASFFVHDCEWQRAIAGCRMPANHERHRAHRACAHAHVGAGQALLLSVRPRAAVGVSSGLQI